MATTLGEEVGVRRVYETTANDAAGAALRLSDRQVDLGKKEFEVYSKLVEQVPSNRSAKEVAAELGMDEPRLRKWLEALQGAGLLYAVDAAPASISGVDFHQVFTKILPSWLDEAFAHPF